MGNLIGIIIEGFESFIDEPKITNAKKRIGKVKEQIESGKMDAELNLSNLGLTSEDLDLLMPIIIEELPDLKIFNLSGNNITIVSDSIGNLRSLKKLNLSFNKIESLPEDIDLCFSLSILNLKGNTIQSFSLECISSLDELDLERVCLDENPLSLGGIFQISTIEKSREIVKLAPAHNCLLNHICNSSSETDAIARRVVKTHPDVSAKEFSLFAATLLASNYHQLRGIVYYDLPLSELGIGLDENGKLTNKLVTNIPLSHELLDRTVKIKDLTVKTTIEAFNIAKKIEKILNFGLSEDQIGLIISVEIGDFVYQEIAKKIKEINYSGDDQEMKLDELTEEDKDLARTTFNEIYQEFILEQAKDKGEVQQINEEQDNISLDSFSSDPIIGMFVDMEKPINSGKKQEEKQRNNADKKTNDFRPKSVAFNHKI